MEFPGIGMSAWDDMELLSSPSRREGHPHRRMRSDPTDIMQALRAERMAWGGQDELCTTAAPKRDLSPTGLSPAYKRQHARAYPPEEKLAYHHQPLWHTSSLDGELVHTLPCEGEEDGAGEAAPVMVAESDEAVEKNSKKDVPMWTVEEDLLIMQLVERHGKRWSKIAAHLPGRTDNGVRNRWNRMERAQVLRQRRGPEAGYRCRRCGQPKRGHICAALTLGETPAGEELQQKAEALSRLSADRMRPTLAASETIEPPAAQSTPPLAAQPSPELRPCEEPVPAPLRQSPVALTPIGVVAAPMGATAAADRAELRAEFDEAQLDEFLDELQLHELAGRGRHTDPEAAAAAATSGQQLLLEQGNAAMLSQASLMHLLLGAGNLQSSAQPRFGGNPSFGSSRALVF